MGSSSSRDPSGDDVTALTEFDEYRNIAPSETRFRSTTNDRVHTRVLEATSNLPVVPDSTPSNVSIVPNATPSNVPVFPDLTSPNVPVDQSICIEHGDEYEIQSLIQKEFISVKWYYAPFEKVERPIDISNTSKYKKGTTGFPSLTILNFTHSDTGSYMYYVSYQRDYGTVVEHSHKWDLYCGPSVEILKDEYYVKKGKDRFTIESSVGGKPKNIVWYFSPNKGTKRQIDPSYERHYEGARIHNPSLTILHISVQDEGKYTCCAQYDHCEEKTASTNIVVQRIEITPTKGIAVAGDTSFTFECIIKGVKTISESNWFKTTTNNDDKLIRGDQYESYRNDWNHNLTIKSISKTNAQIYKFKAKVDGDTELELYSELIVNGEIPTVLINESNFQVQTGTNFAIPCQVTAIPAARKIYWELTPPGKGSHMVDVNAENKYSGSTTVTESLTIKGFDAEDIGFYRCFAENAVGTAKSRFVTLIEKEPLRFVLFGPIGGGKSSIGNIFLQNEVFPRRRGSMKESFTKEFKIAEEVVRCKRLEIVDTPGVRNSTDRGDLEISVENFRNATRCSSYRPNASLLIVALESPFDESFLCFLNELSEEELKCVIVIFTTNRIREESREELLENVHESLRAFLLEKKWESFFVDINYNDSFNLHMQKVIPTINELVQYCKVTRRQNDDFYNTKCYCEKSKMTKKPNSEENSERKVTDGFDF